MKIDEIKRYFDEGVVDPSREDDFLQGEEIYDVLYPSGENLDENRRNRRDTILHLYLWDSFFYTGDLEKSADTDMDVIPEGWWTPKRKKDVILCLGEGEEKLSKLIFDIIKHWDFLKIDIFKNDYELLKKCKESKSPEELSLFIQNHSNTYPEYLLLAEYYLSELAHIPFKNLQKALKEYKDSKWVKEIECKQTKSGITYMFTKDFVIDKNEKKCIISFLEDFTSIGSAADPNEGNKQRHLFANHVVTEEVWNIVMKQHQLFTSNALNPKMVNYNELETFINEIQQMTCVKFRIPTSNERKTLALGIKEISENNQCLWEWCLSVDGDSPHIQVACNKHGQDTQDHRTHIYSVPNSCFAACRLVVDI